MTTINCLGWLFVGYGLGLITTGYNKWFNYIPVLLGLFFIGSDYICGWRRG